MADAFLITKSLYYKSMTEYHFTEPKTQAGIRDIDIDADTIKELKEVQQKVIPDCNFVLSYVGIPTSKHTLPRALEKLAELASVHRIKIQTTLGTYGYLYPNSNFDVAKKLTGIHTYTPASHSVDDYTSNQFTADYCKQVNLKMQ